MALNGRTQSRGYGSGQTERRLTVHCVDAFITKISRCRLAQCIYIVPHRSGYVIIEWSGSRSMPYRPACLQATSILHYPPSLYGHSRVTSMNLDWDEIDISGRVINECFKYPINSRGLWFTECMSCAMKSIHKWFMKKISHSLIFLHINHSKRRLKENTRWLRNWTLVSNRTSTP